MATNTTNAYVPGVCNINQTEVAYRRKAGHLGLAIFIILLVAVLSLGLNRIIRIALFFPAFLAAIGYLQAQQKFCVGYGAAGKQNATDGSSVASDVEAAAAKIDKARARKLNLQATAVALVTTLIALALPPY